MIILPWAAKSFALSKEECGREICREPDTVTQFTVVSRAGQTAGRLNCYEDGVAFSQREETPMDEVMFSEQTTDLLLIVERLSTQDQRRLVRLVSLLASASSELRDQTQRRLRELIARVPETHAECLDEIDEIIARVEHRLELELLLASKPQASPHVADGRF